MLYSLVLKPSVLKQINKLPKRDQQKVKHVLESFTINPFSGKKLAGEFEGLYSVRVWPYRIIYSIIKKDLIVLVVDVAHRQGAYK